jgi:hypothetical protein
MSFSSCKSGGAEPRIPHDMPRPKIGRNRDAEITLMRAATAWETLANLPRSRPIRPTVTEA